MVVSSRQIRSERHVEIGSLIERDRGIVIDRWRRRAEEEQPQAKRVHREVLLDQLDGFLSALGRRLAEEGDLEGGRHCVPAVEHGEQRWETGWSLPELVRDYQLLRIVLVEYLDETLERPLSCREVMAVGLALDEAIGASVARYVESREGYVRQMERERAEREKQVEAARLRQQAEALREEARRREAFLATLGHELRNPLGPIRNAVHLLRQVEGNAERVGWAKDVIERQAQHMTRLVEELLEVSRIAQGKVRLERRPVDLARIVRETAEDRAGVPEEAGVTLSVDVGEGPVVVEGDRVRLTQVVANLLHNATKFTERGGRVGVRLVADREAGRAVVTVSDTGIGIDAAELPHLFEKFRQAESGRDHSRGGLGLGLALVKGLVELHGGGVGAASAGPGQGATFTFWVPLAQGAAEADPPAAAPAAGKSLKILVVDDNQDSADSWRLLLAEFGHQVAVAYSGPEAVEIAKQMRPEVVLCDIGLPGMDGYAVAGALRREAGTARARLIAVSGYGSQADARRCRQAGFERLLAKPVEPVELQRVLAGEAG